MQSFRWPGSMAELFLDLLYDQVSQSGRTLPANYIFAIRSVGYGSDAKLLAMTIYCLFSSSRLEHIFLEINYSSSA